MASKTGQNIWPFYSEGKKLQVRTSEELMRLILESDDVKDAITGTVN